MSTNIFLILSIIVGLVVVGLGIAVYIINRKERKEPDYRVFFTLGLIWLPLGIVFFTSMSNPTFLGLGTVFLIIGLANRDKWKKQPTVFSDKNKLITLILIGTALLVLLTLGVWLFNTSLFT